MRRLLDALVLAVLGYALLFSNGHAAPLDASDVADVRVTPQARVIRQFGANVRAEPGGDAEVLDTVSCGDVLPVIGFQDGWVHVIDGDIDGWIGGSRVAVGSPPAPAHCEGARTFYLGEEVATSVKTGCLSLRNEPSEDARMLSCVKNGHEYTIWNGPFDPGTGDDWFFVYSPSTGYGYVLAKYLVPA